MNRARACLLATCFLASGCAEGSDVGTPGLLRDSAGIQVVESRAPAWREGQSWWVEVAPDYEFGG